MKTGHRLPSTAQSVNPGLIFGTPRCGVDRAQVTGCRPSCLVFISLLACDFILVDTRDPAAQSKIL